MNALREVLVQSLLLLLLIGSLGGVAIGIGLVIRTQAMLGFFGRMNRWVLSGMDTRAREEHPVEGPSAMSTPQRRIAGAVFVLGGAFSALVLATMPKIPAVALLQARGGLWTMSLLLADGLRWLLTVGCVFAAVAGIMLLFFPGAWKRMEVHANHWHSTKRFFVQTDVMHMPLDRWIERSPRPAGALIAVLSVVSLVAFAALLLLRK
jgi:hypothetical protein